MADALRGVAVHGHLQHLEGGHDDAGHLGGVLGLEGLVQHVAEADEGDRPRLPAPTLPEVDGSPGPQRRWRDVGNELENSPQTLNALKSIALHSPVQAGKVVSHPVGFIL